MAKPTKPLSASRTTQNVAGGTLGGATVGMAMTTILRGIFGDALWWDPPGDDVVAAGLTVVLAPLLSRLLAVWRE